MIRPYVRDILLPEGDIARVRDMVVEHGIETVHWHSFAYGQDEQAQKSLALLSMLKKLNIRVVETSPFSLYNPSLDALLDRRLFVSRTNLLKYFWKYGKDISDKNKYAYLYNPLDTEELSLYKLDHTARGALRSRYHIPFDAFVIGKVGRANLWKWDDTIINIVPKLLPSIPHLRVVIRALPPEKLARIRRLGIEQYFILLPESPREKDITETYQLMDVMLHTSRIGECNSVSINEALFFGIPIITKSTDFSRWTIFGRDNGQAEMIEHGVNGYIENDLDHMAKLIIGLSQNADLRLRMSIANVAKAQNILNPTLLTDCLEQMLSGSNVTIQEMLPTIEEYRRSIPHESLISRSIESMKAVYESILAPRFKLPPL